MTTNDEVVGQLVLEVDDLLGAGSVGLYEFVDTLRAIDPDGSVDDWRATSRAALDQLLRSNRATMRWKIWGDTGFDESADDVKPDNIDWLAHPSAEPYLVVVPTG